MKLNIWKRTENYTMRRRRDWRREFLKRDVWKRKKQEDPDENELKMLRLNLKQED